MKTVDDFINDFNVSISKYDALESRYRTGDPLLTTILTAVSTQMAMLSTQIDLAIVEPFQPTKKATILAAASLRGLLPKASPCRVKIFVNNSNSTAYTFSQNQVLLDNNNREYYIDTPITIAANGSDYIEATQITKETVTHTVVNSVPFYAIEIQPQGDNGDYICALSVSDNNGNNYQYSDNYVNVYPDVKSFTVETDIQAKFYIRFGWQNNVGYQPPNSTILTITACRTFGDIDLKTNTHFSFDIQNTQTRLIDLTFDSFVTNGIDEMPLNIIADLCKFPAIYNNNAVFLTDFEFLIRRNYTNLKFFRIWNESLEETFRGASLENINCLFVAVMSNTANEIRNTVFDTLTTIDYSALTDTQKSIRQTLLNADNTYQIKFYPPVIAQLNVHITVTVSYSYGKNDIQSSIQSVMMANYGQDAMRGQKTMLKKDIHTLLRTNIKALSDVNADIDVTISNVYKNFEYWQFVDASSLTIIVNQTTVIIPAWNNV